LKIKEGFIIFELSVSLFIEIILFLGVSVFTLYGLSNYISKMGDMSASSEMINLIRLKSSLNPSGKLTNLSLKKIRTENVSRESYYYFKIGNSLSYLDFYDGKLKSPGGNITDKNMKIIFNIVPVTGAVTLP